jgi:ABC-type transport system involved in multi-copper enzyme maturation permease subunit
MKAIIWKEWHENRLILAWASLLTFGVSIIGMWLNAGSSSLPPTSDAFVGIAILPCGLSAMLCGAAMISPDIGSGSLQFLSTLPISRARIWLAKCLFGVCLAAGTIAASLVSMAIYVAIAVATHHMRPASPTPYQWPIEYYTAPILLFAIGAAAGTTFDRTISALMASVIVAGMVFPTLTLISDLAQKYAPSYVDVFYWVVFAAWTAAFLSASFTVFTRGESLKTEKRMWIMAGFGLPAIVVVIGIAIVHAVYAGSPIR